MGGTDVKTVALIVCITATAIFLVSFIMDYVIKRSGQPTISQLVWQDPLLGIPALFPLFVAFVALVVHFYYR